LANEEERFKWEKNQAKDPEKLANHENEGGMEEEELKRATLKLEIVGTNLCSLGRVGVAGIQFCWRI